MWPSLAIALPTFHRRLAGVSQLRPVAGVFRGTALDTGGVILCVALMSISGLFYVIGGQYLMGKLWHWFPDFRLPARPGCLEIHGDAGAGQPDRRHRRFEPFLPRAVHRGNRQGLRAHRARQGVCPICACCSSMCSATR
jgi:hypothetical protein